MPIPGQTIAIIANGQREVSQHATLDGVVATEARVNTVPFSPSPEAMEEVRVISGSYSAEYGFNCRRTARDGHAIRHERSPRLSIRFYPQ